MDALPVDSENFLYEICDRQVSSESDESSEGRLRRLNCPQRSWRDVHPGNNPEGDELHSGEDAIHTLRRISTTRILPYRRECTKRSQEFRADTLEPCVHNGRQSSEETGGKRFVRSKIRFPAEVVLDSASARARLSKTLPTRSGGTRGHGTLTVSSRDDSTPAGMPSEQSASSVQIRDLASLSSTRDSRPTRVSKAKKGSKSECTENERTEYLKLTSSSSFYKMVVGPLVSKRVREPPKTSEEGGLSRFFSISKKR